MAKAAQAKPDPAGAAFESDAEDNIIVNLEDIEEMSFEALPSATYAVAIEKCEYKLSNASGQPMWSVQLNVLDGKYAGRKLFGNLSFSEKALPGTKSAIKIIAPNLLTGDFNPKKIAEDGDLIGWEGRVRVGQDEYMGRDTNPIKSWMAAENSASGFVS